MSASRPCSRLATPSATREVLEAHGLSTKKALGQHFLVDDRVVARILGLADLRSDETVLEVGPGIGTLTVALLPACRAVVSIERDRDLAPVLAQTCAPWRDRFGLVVGDALRQDVSDIERACASLDAPLPCKLVSNLPYAVAATVLLDCFERYPFVRSAVVMVQREVADRIAAIPGTKAYGAYTVKFGLYAEVGRRFEVSPASFFPPPHVGSSVIELVRRTPLLEGAPASDELVRTAALMADAAFSQRRKTLLNSMGSHLARHGFPREQVRSVIEAAGIDSGVRGETLGQEEFLRLARAVRDQ